MAVAAGDWRAAVGTRTRPRLVTFSVFNVDAFGTRLRRVIGAVSQSDMLRWEKKIFRNGARRGCRDTGAGEGGREEEEDERSREGVGRVASGRIGTNVRPRPTIATALLLPPCCVSSERALFSPPRGRSENHAARPLDRPARSRDSANIGEFGVLGRGCENRGVSSRTADRAIFPLRRDAGRENRDATE